MDFLPALGIKDLNSGAYQGSWLACGGDVVPVHSPATGGVIASIQLAQADEYENVAQSAHEAFLRWRELPAPLRGDYVRRIGNAFRENKDALAELLSWESGKILQEGLGEIQEAIDIADFAVGLSRQLHGLTIVSERPEHHMRETWHPLGTIGVITAFNFPGAVWAWNSMLALVCGDSVLWKPSLKTPLTAIAMTKIAGAILATDGYGAVVSLIIGKDDEVGDKLIRDRRIPLISATGSTRMGKEIGKVVAERLGRSLLELGGNNAIIVMDDADLDLALRAVLFGAVGTAGQRCTSTRRLYLQEKIASTFTARLQQAYASVKIGNPLDATVLMGPLIDKEALDTMQEALRLIRSEGGEIIHGGKPLSLEGELAGGHYVEPCLVRARPDMPLLQHETFAPILYICEVKSFEEALRYQNDVPQGLSSAIFTMNVRYSEAFLSASGSDCGIANVNLGTSGAEIGGAFGGEKETGGGRESGSDAWKIYMRRQTSTINYGNDLPLAQGIQFGG